MSSVGPSHSEQVPYEVTLEKDRKLREEAAEGQCPVCKPGVRGVHEDWCGMQDYPLGGWASGSCGTS